MGVTLSRYERCVWYHTHQSGTHVLVLVFKKLEALISIYLWYMYPVLCYLYT
jgi:hypothetical protein